MSLLLLLWAIAAFADVLLFFNYSTAVNWRYFLTGLPGLAPLAASWWLAVSKGWLGSLRRAMVACLVTIGVLSVAFGIIVRPVSREFILRRALSREYKERLAQVPTDAVMISG